MRPAIRAHLIGMMEAAFHQGEDAEVRCHGSVPRLGAPARRRAAKPIEAVRLRFRFWHRTGGPAFRTAAVVSARQYMEADGVDMPVLEPLQPLEGPASRRLTTATRKTGIGTSEGSLPDVSWMKSDLCRLEKAGRCKCATAVTYGRHRKNACLNCMLSVTDATRCGTADVYGQIETDIITDIAYG